MYAKLNRREMCCLAAAAAAEWAIGLRSVPATAAEATSLSPEEARKIAQQAYVYCSPIVQNYLSIYELALDPSGSQYKGPPNEVHNVARVFTSADTAIITPNSDTPYSYLIMDLRAEPMVVTLPAIEKGRYYSLQLVDLYTNNVDYPGTREDGNGGGTFLIVGPGWNGKVPAGIKRAVQISTPLMFSQFRTQLFDPADLDNVKKIQSGYKAQPLSAFLNQPPRVAQKISYPSIDRSSFEPKFWQYANFLLQYCPTLPSEKDLRADFSRIGIAPGAPWPPPGMPTDVNAAVEEGRQDARKDLEVSASKLTSSVGIFGTPQEMAGKYKERAMGAMLGIYGNTPVEAIYPGYQRDSSGKLLDTSKSNYTVTFAPGRLPPVNAFWSVTMYDGKTRFLVDNPIHRYLINSPMLPALKRNPDGGVTMYLQHKSPGKDLEPNWLPAPDGPMFAVVRLYLPKHEALDGSWSIPAIHTAGSV